MMETVFTLMAALLVGYLIGGIPFAVITGRLAGVRDIRRHGSGNMGTMNVVRVAGKLPGLLTLLLDVGKGVFVVWLGSSLGSGVIPLLAAYTAILGHMFPVYTGFRGGKSLAVYIGSMSLISFPVLIFVAFTWFFCWLLWRRVAVSSAVSFGLSPVFMFFLSHTLEVICYGFLAGITIAARHYPDIKAESV